MNDRRLRLIHLYQSKIMTRTLLRDVIRKDPTINTIYTLSAVELVQYCKISNKRAQQLYRDLHDDYLLRMMKNDLKECHVTTIFDENYPPLLRTIPDPPLVLYFLGNQQLLTHFPSISVVGTRNPTPEALKKIDTIISPLIIDGWSIISGMAVGIDGMAHRAACKLQGKTIAVLGGGFNYVYPYQHRKLFDEISKTQLVISEYPPNTKPQRFHFPERNRIISGLSFGTIVIEAKEKSGSLITVEQALDQGREVYAVPGSLFSEETKGCHKMIQDGAKLVQNTYDILEDWDDLEGKWCRILSDFTENSSS